MKNFKNCLLLLGILNCLGSAAQIKRLSIGEKVPQLSFKNIVNGECASLGAAKLSKKIIILDFWNTTCGACIEEMPLVSQLQKKFKDQVQLIMVTKQPKVAVEGFFKKHTDLKRLQIPGVTDDVFLRKLFPHESNPHLVWIGRDRVIKAITGGEELTEENLQLLLKQNKLTLPFKFDREGFDYSDGPPLLQSGTDFTSRALAFSTLTRYNENIAGTRLGITYAGETDIRVRALNASLLNLFTFAWSPVIQFAPGLKDSRLIFNMRDKRMLTNIPKDRSNFFCYELSLSKSLLASADKQKVLNYMRRDLDHLFHLKSSVEGVLTDCYVISAAEAPPQILKDSASQLIQYLDSVHYQNLPVVNFAATLPLLYDFAYPVILEGKTDKIITVTMKKTYSSFAELELVLQTIGLAIRQEKRIVPMLIFNDAE